MSNDVLKFRNKILFVSPQKIQNCIYPSKYCDYTQFNSNRIHPHAGINRGVFRDNVKGFIKINNYNWDKKKGIQFTKLLEYKAIINHYSGKENWKKSEFASRIIKFKKNYTGDKYFKRLVRPLSLLEKDLDQLINSIIRKGVYAHGVDNNKKQFVDNISVAITNDRTLLFNNRGHHRVSIAKILKIKLIPVKIAISKNVKVIKNLLSNQ
jgi:hypothetical protein